MPSTTVATFSSLDDHFTVENGAFTISDNTHLVSICAVQDIINELTLVIGEKITIRRFVRWEVGEGLEKRQDDFAAEVAAQAGGNV